ncbi:MAG: GIY-YIG nuclease family protein [Phenylobacterium sp.]
MDKQSRREAVREFKERKVQRGVFALRCAPAGRVWVAASRNLDQQQNSIWFGLKSGGYANPEAQAAWREHGEAAFAFEVLEAFDDEALSPIGRADLAKARAAHWRSELGAAKLVG